MTPFILSVIACKNAHMTIVRTCACCFFFLVNMHVCDCKQWMLKILACEMYYATLMLITSIENISRILSKIEW